MINRKKKICKGCQSEQFLFSESLCKTCYFTKYPPQINKKSDKKKSQDKEYIKLRDEYLLEHPFCEVGIEGCTIKATEIHHSKGRGIFYLLKKYFKAVCASCHSYITEHSSEAINNGYSKSRIKE